MVVAAGLSQVPCGDGAVGLATIEAAQARIAGEVLRTPLIRSAALSAAGSPVHLKLETHQGTGSFKLRGATNAVLSLDPPARARGLVTASTGNHGRALAHAARAQGVRAVICMSRLVPANKVAAVEALGAEVRIVGRSQDEAQLEVARLVREEGLTEVPPFDHAAVVAGQGTIGLEIVADLADVALVLVPLSGGGLAAGVAAAVKGLRPQARVIGVSMRRGAAMQASLAAGRPVAVEEVETLADSLGGGIGLDNRLTFALCRDLLDGVVLLDEAEIAAGIRHVFAAEGEVVEGAGAVGIAALLAGKVEAHGPVAVVVSGGNIDAAAHRRIIEGAA
ncbi:hydroxyectoine utilization dehydratase EutB [Labrys wisconsinensis]|uniref:Threonine dehydratase n=1 Tax=Labrys wisconsinensis TaxID=425677 RepID=A0ABU0JDA9_9HYPH|nr:hydroxyectoine utilization dehydratase EutB [Labrys wisconsinensis]MDQ0472267.1 threonine dehydratase [Labrys wisconsinensis]